MGMVVVVVVEDEEEDEGRSADVLSKVLSFVSSPVSKLLLVAATLLRL